MYRWIVPIAGLLCAAPALAAQPKPALQPAPMPYVFRDDRGSIWDIQPDSMIADGGNDLFDGAARLSVGEQPYGVGGQVSLDPATQELVFPAVPMQGLNVSRRVGCNPKLAYLRYTEILENPSPVPVKATVRVYFNMGGSVQYAKPVIDQRKSKGAIGQIIGDQTNCMVLIGAGRGSKLLPRYAPQQGNDNVDVYWDLEIPAKQTVAVTHLIVRRSTAAEAEGILDELDDKQIVKELSPEIARKLVNFQRGEHFLDDEEILRGELFDVIELRGGDQYKGTIKQETFRLQTFHGLVELPAGRVVAMMSAGQFRPRQLVVTSDGQIFGGSLEGGSVRLEMSNGQATDVPIAQIARFGYRRRANEPEEWKFDKPLVILRGGDRMVVSLPSSPVDIATRYGRLSLPPASIASIAFVSDDHGVHDITLTDGSRFAGLVAGEVSLKLADSPEPVTFPLGELRRLQLSPAGEIEGNASTLTLSNGDQLVGTLGGVVKLQTGFDTLSINGAEIRTLRRVGATAVAGDVQITLWDNAVLSGRLETDTLPLVLKGGVSMRAPLGLIDVYANPQPRPPAQVGERIKAIVAELNADDWKARDRAEEQLKAIGPAVVVVLQELRPSQMPEPQQRIDAIIKAVAGPAGDQADACPHCPGAQAPNADGRCPSCGMKLTAR